MFRQRPKIALHHLPLQFVLRHPYSKVRPTVIESPARARCPPPGVVSRFLLSGQRDHHHADKGDASKAAHRSDDARPDRPKSLPRSPRQQRHLPPTGSLRSMTSSPCGDTSSEDSRGETSGPGARAGAGAGDGGDPQSSCASSPKSARPPWSPATRPSRLNSPHRLPRSAGPGADAEDNEEDDDNEEVPAEGDEGPSTPLRSVRSSQAISELSRDALPALASFSSPPPGVQVRRGGAYPAGACGSCQTRRGCRQCCLGSKGDENSSLGTDPSQARRQN